MKKLIVILALIGFSQVSYSQIRYDTAVLVSKSDPIYPALDEFRKKIQKSYDDSKHSLPSFQRDWISIESPAAARIFPSLRFAAIGWFERLNPEYPKTAPQPALAFGLHITVGVAKSSNLIQAELDGHGNYEYFGELLAKHRVRISDGEDAKNVWEAFCDLHFKHWKDKPALKISDTTWHLGDTTIDQFHYYYEVLMDEQHIVKSAILHADRVN